MAEQQAVAARRRLVNVKHVRDYILAQVAAQRPAWHCTRVSGQVVADLEARLAAMIVRAVQRHPSVGQTFSQLT